MTRFILILLFIILSGCSRQAPPKEISVWKSVSEHDEKCIDIYRFQSNQTIIVESGSQRLITSYAFKYPDNSEFTGLTTKVLESNKQPDCLGNNIDHVGTEQTFYVKLNSKGDEMHYYYEPKDSEYLDFYFEKIR